MMKIITRDKWLMVIAAMGVVLYMGFTGYVVLNDKSMDYYVYLVSAHALVNGENVYTMPASAYERIAEQLGVVTHTGPYLYPTFTALLLIPLTYLPLRLGAAIWICLGGLAVLMSALILCSFTTEKRKQRTILATTIVFFPVLTSMNLGQVNPFVLLMTVLTLYCFRRNLNLLGGGDILAGYLVEAFCNGSHSSYDLAEKMENAGRFSAWFFGD